MFAGMSLISLLIYIVILAGVIAIVIVGLRAMGVSLPAWFVQILWIIAIVVVVVVANKFVIGLF